jgi:hypothetical protein
MLAHGTPKWHGATIARRLSTALIRSGNGVQKTSIPWRFVNGGPRDGCWTITDAVQLTRGGRGADLGQLRFTAACQNSARWRYCQ